MNNKIIIADILRDTITQYYNGNYTQWHNILAIDKLRIMQIVNKRIRDLRDKTNNRGKK